MDAHDYMALSTTTLIREAESMLLGQVKHTPEAELALALLDRVEELEARNDNNDTD